VLASSMSRSFGIARLPRTPLRRRSQNQSVWDERMHPAGLANDPLAFRVALKSSERAGLQAMELSRIRGGAA